MFSGIYLEFPALLQLLWVIPIQVLMLWVYWRWRTRTLRLLGSAALEERLLLGFSGTRFWVKNLLFAFGTVLVALAISGPVKIVKAPGKKMASSDILIALDISNSMLASDVKPSRLQQAKDMAFSLVKALEGERIGLLFFAGEAFPQMPLSTDHESVTMFIRNAHPDFITDQGTDIGAAIELGNRMLETDKATGRAIILISDGENHEEKALQRALEARESGVMLYTIAVGTAAGAAIPGNKAGVRQDFTGKTIRSSADEPFLGTLANAVGGQSFNARDGARTVETIKNAVRKLQKTAVEAHASSEKQYFFPWILLLALLVLIAEQVMWWKKKLPAAIFLLCFLGTQAEAQSTHRALVNGDQKYDRSDYDAAQTAYEKAGSALGFYNAGNAALQLKNLASAALNFQKAVELSNDKSLKSDALYNLGNTLMLQNKFPEAIKAYESSLRLNPNRPDAQKNLQIAKRSNLPPPPQPPPPPPPPPSNKPRQIYLDRALQPRQKEQAPAEIPAETARQILSKAVLKEEEKNAKAYRELSPANKPSRVKKDW
jgi:Ca-activated chloride channel family protein